MYARMFCERPFLLSVLCMCFGAVVPTTPVVVTASACSTAVGPWSGVPYHGHDGLAPFRAAVPVLLGDGYSKCFFLDDRRGVAPCMWTLQCVLSLFLGSGTRGVCCGYRKCLFRNRFGCGLASSSLLASACVRVL